MQANQPGQQADRIRAAVEKNPRKMTLQLARDLSVPEVEVLRAFPPERVRELDITRWEEFLRSLEGLGPVRVLVSNGATTIEVDGRFGGFSVRDPQMDPSDPIWVDRFARLRDAFDVRTARLAA